MLIFGTRPEAIKMAPVVKELQKHDDTFRTSVCVTAQHRWMLDQVLDLFKIKPNFDLDLMQPDQTLSQLTARTLTALDPILKETNPDWVLVQGDTTTAMTAGIAAFYRRIRIGHIEAGLRTDNKLAPFPEEINRRLTSVMADLHFAPTEKAQKALLLENIPADRIAVTGNTVIDSLLWVKDQIRRNPPDIPESLRSAMSGRKLILITGHRRENFGKRFEEICLAIKDLVLMRDDICVVYPVHLNPRVKEPVYRILGDVSRVHLIEPLSYAPFVWFMDNAHLILTDSGGVQEEAPSLGKPVLVMREVTERPEGIEAGCSRLVGVDRVRIINGILKLLDNKEEYDRMSQTRNPYGDGNAAERIVRILRDVRLTNNRLSLG